MGITTLKHILDKDEVCCNISTISQSNCIALWIEKKLVLFLSTNHQCSICKDIKPANILINPKTKQIKLIDFSIASLLPKETQRSFTGVGFHSIATQR